MKTLKTHSHKLAHQDQLHQPLCIGSHKADTNWLQEHHDQTRHIQMSQLNHDIRN